MAEQLHRSHNAAGPAAAMAGVFGALAHPGQPPAQHAVHAPQAQAYPAWVPASPNPHLGFVLDPGVRHKQEAAYADAAQARAQEAAAAARDDGVGVSKRRGRTPTGEAAPYQKSAAQRAAERALRPWDPAAGLGERRGAAVLQVAGANAGASAFAPEDAPSLYQAPGLAEVNAHAAAAGQVARRGQGQPGALGAYAIQQGAVERELWPANAAAPPKYCTACKGGHDASKEGSTSWQAYTPVARLANLTLLDTKFQRALTKGRLLCHLSDSHWEPVRWDAQPQTFSGQHFTEQLALALDGIREGHEPHRFLATRAVEHLLDVAAAVHRLAAALPPAAPQLVAPLKLCCNTMQPQLVGGMLLLLNRMLRVQPALAPALAPYLRHLLPSLAVFRQHRRPMELPAPVCVAPGGTFGGHGVPADAGGRACRVCGAPVDREHDAAVARAKVAAGLAANAALAGAEADMEALLPQQPKKRLPGRECRRLTLEVLIEETLGLLAASGGEVARRVIRSYIPSFTYVGPEDQLDLLTVEERLERLGAASGVPAARGRVPGPGSAGSKAAASRSPARPGTAGACPSTPSLRPPSPSPAHRPGSAPRSNSAAGRGGVGGRQVRQGGKGGSRGLGDRPSWDSGPAVSPQDLSRWDGMEFQPKPLYLVNDYGSAARNGPEHAGDKGPGTRGSAGGRGTGRRASAGGGGGGWEVGPTLSIQTPVPIFDSPYDPVYRMLSDDWACSQDAAHRSVTFAKAGPEVVAKGGAPRGGVGGGGSGAWGVNVNAVVPYRDSPAGLRRAF